MAAVKTKGLAPGGEDPTTFEELGLKPWLCEAVEHLGMSRPTPVQANCIPSILSGRDVMGGAPTGSGKTAAFALPILDKLSEDPYGVFAVVLTPTRELAFQIGEQFRAFGNNLSLKMSVVVGGMDMMRQALELQRRPHVVVATPGRFVDHLRSSEVLRLAKLKFLVLDEADRLLDLGFADELQAILDAMPERRQTLLFSATMTKSLDELRRCAMEAPHVYDGCPTYTTPKSLLQEYLFVPLSVKECYLLRLLTEEFEGKTCIVFGNTCKKVQMLFHFLSEAGIGCTPLHSRQTMNRRLASLGKFAAGKTDVLLATDVAGRGLDIPEVEVVINYDIPSLATDYVHRVGRTARAGRRGHSVSLVSQYDIELFLAIEERIGGKIPEMELEEEEVLKLLNQAAAARRVAKLMLTETGFDEERTGRGGGKNKKQKRGADSNGGETGAGEKTKKRKKKKKTAGVTQKHT